VVTTTSTSTIIHIRTPDDVVNACEVGRDIARNVGFSDVDQVKVATATAELTRNVLLYAKVGEMRLASLEAPRRGIEIEVSDEGPGIADIDLVLSGHYRSRTGMGMGLRGTKRLVDTFELASSPAGTRVLARKFVK
jgi:serine/threonine-protein kinase RsbT